MDKAQSDLRVELAQSLVRACSFLAMSTVVAHREIFPVEHFKDPEEWSLILTVAAIFSGTYNLNTLELADEQKQALRDIIAKNLEEWNPLGSIRLRECKNFFYREFGTQWEKNSSLTFKDLAEWRDPGEIRADVLGRWIFQNMFGKEPDGEEEFVLMGLLAYIVMSNLSTYWE